MMLFRMASASTIKGIVDIIGSLIFALILFRFAATEVVGQYYFWQSLLFFGGLVFGSFAGSAAFILPKARERADLYILAEALIVGPLALIIYFPLFSFFRLPQPLLLAVITALINIGSLSIRAFLNAFQVKRFLLTSILGFALKLSFILGVVFIYKELTFTMLIASLICMYLPSWALLVKMGLYHFPLWREIITSIKRITENLSAGISMYIATMLNAIIIVSDVFFIGALLTFRDTGIYNAIGNMIKYVQYAIPGKVSSFVFPVAVRSKGKFLKRAIYLLMILLLPLSVVAVLPTPFVKLLTGDYEEYAHLALLFYPALLLTPLTVPLLNYFLGKKEFHVIYYLLGAAVVNLILNAVFSIYIHTWLYGIAGASTIATLLLTTLLLKAAMEKELLKGGFVKRYLLHIFLFGATLWVLKSFFTLPSHYSMEMALLTGSAAVALAFIINMLLLFAVFPRESRETAAYIMKKIKYLHSIN